MLQSPQELADKYMFGADLTVSPGRTRWLDRPPNTEGRGIELFLYDKYNQNDNGFVYYKTRTIDRYIQEGDYKTIQFEGIDVIAYKEYDGKYLAHLLIDRDEHSRLSELALRDLFDELGELTFDAINPYNRGYLGNLENKIEEKEERIESSNNNIDKYNRKLSVIDELEEMDREEIKERILNIQENSGIVFQYFKAWDGTIYPENAESAVDQYIRNLPSLRSSAERNINYCENDIEDYENQIQSIQDSLENLERYQDHDLFIQSIKNIDLFRKIESIGQNKWALYTKSVYLEHNDVQYNFGSFKVIVKLDEGVKYIYPYRNSNGTPHISTSGGYCSGNIPLNSSFHRYFDIINGFSMLKQLITRYNPASPLRSISNFSPTQYTRT